MKSELQGKFILLWEKYFSKPELPITFFYSEKPLNSMVVPPKKGMHECLIDELGNVRRGQSLAFREDSLGCNGAKKYLGYENQMQENFRYFLSCGISGKMEGERYKRTPEIVDELLEKQQNFDADNKYIIFKRWDKLTDDETPDVVIFFCSPDVLSGLFTLVNFDSADPNQVIAPFGSGCASIITFPYLESKKENPKSVLGMFDPSARPNVGRFELSLAIPMKKFEKIVDYMDESFLITKSWDNIHKRIESKY